MRVRYTEAADQDLDALLATTAEHWPQSLQTTINRLRRFEQTLSRVPEGGAPTRFSGIRRFSLRPLPFVAFYRVTQGEVEILRLYHTSRRPYQPGRA